MANSPNMNLPIPIVGVTQAPQWATLVVNCMNLIDAHDHTPGNGVPITPAGLSINADLPFNSNNATQLRTTRYTSQGSTITPTGAELDEVYVVGGDLYFNSSASGTTVRMTQSGGVAGSPGSITNLASPAAATWVSASSTFVWTSAANTAANMDFQDAIFRNSGASSNGLTVQAPSMTGGNQTITLPLAPTGSSKIVSMDTSGNITAPYTVDGSTIVIAANVIKVPTGGITATQIANNTITATQIANNTITATQIANNTLSDTQITAGGISGASIASSVNLPGNTVQENGLNVLVSSTNAPASLKVIRGQVASNGTVAAGEGFTSGINSAGNYTLTWSTAFSGTPILVGCISNGTGMFSASAFSTTTATIDTFNSTGTHANQQFTFIAIGPR